MILYFLRFLQYFVVEDQERFYIFDPQFFTKLREQDAASNQPHDSFSSYNNNPFGSFSKSPTKKKPSIAYGFTRVKRWTKKVDIFAKEFLLVPICENNHWTLAIICYP